ncbi:DUF5681 domain-containing protein [Candidatus Avelusimicrobium fimicolum]|jgi:hypothetical protein|uniref:DUF5681 domain-containing protein n=1 Tax=Candidatus Avelusimicrobium fimicolum TaxID=3416216 RepID=UPI003D0D3001
MTDNEVKEVTAQAESTAPKQYEVGYGKPPKKTQFKPGQSGNPKGRTKGSRNGIYTYVQRELNSSITLTDGTRITKEQGLARQLTNKALRGDIQSQKLLFNIHQKSQRKDKAELFMGRLIKEGYVTEEMIDNFLYHNKMISSAKQCDPMKCDLNLNAMFKQIGGRNAFGTALILSDLLCTYACLFILENLWEEISQEYAYWQGVDDATTNLAEEQKAILYKTLAENRSNARITDEQYEQIQKVIELVRIGFMRQFKEYMDLMTETSEYDTVEREFKHGDMLTEALKKTHFPSEIESLIESFEHFKNVYETAQVLPSAEQCEKYIKELNISEEEAIKTIKELLIPLLFKRYKE